MLLYEGQRYWSPVERIWSGSCLKLVPIHRTYRCSSAVNPVHRQVTVFIQNGGQLGAVIRKLVKLKMLPEAEAYGISGLSGCLI
jgi:hypothetical protein